MKTAYRFRMHPNKQQEASLDLILDTCRYLYNLALANRKDAHVSEGVSRSYEDQAAMLVVEKNDGNFKAVFSQVLQDVLRRLDKSFKAFFRRVRGGEMPGRPRFKGQGWYKVFHLSPSRIQTGWFETDSLQDRFHQDIQVVDGR